MTATEITMFQGVSESIATAIADATTAQLASQSPCAGWTARDVLNHMIGGADLFGASARGEERPLPDWSDMPDWVGDDPPASYHRSASELIAAFSAKGVLDGTVPMPWGETPATFAVNLIMADHVTHAWDLTRATGLTIDIQDRAVDTALDTSHASISPEFRAAGLYGPEQTAPADAPPLDRLAAFTGRSL